VKKFKCPDCGEGFDNIFEYMIIHDINAEVSVNLGDGVSIDLMQMLEDIFFLLDEDEPDEIKQLVSGVAGALYASAQGYLPEIINEIQKQEDEVIDDIVKQEVKDLDKQIQKLLRSRENGGY
jgi:hypothetical protein